MGAGLGVLCCSSNGEIEDQRSRDRFTAGEQTQFVKSGIGLDDKFHRLPDSPKVRCKDGEESLGVVPDPFIHSNRYLDGGLGIRGLDLGSDVAFKGGPASQVFAYRFTVAEDFGFGG